MSAGSEAKIISLIKQKSDGGDFNPLYLGPEQRFTKSLRKSNNNNLEEQLLMGADRIVTSWTEGVTKREHTEFRDNEDVNETGYYILDSYIYEEIADAGKDYYIEDNVLHVSGNTTSIDSNGRLLVSDTVYEIDNNNLIIDVSAALSVDNDAYVKGNSLMFNLGAASLDPSDNTILLDGKGDGFMTYDDSEKALLLSAAFILRQDILRFKQDDGNILDVSQKITTKKYGSDGVNVTKEIITNFL